MSSSIGEGILVLFSVSKILSMRDNFVLENFCWKNCVFDIFENLNCGSKGSKTDAKYFVTKTFDLHVFNSFEISKFVGPKI